MEAVLQTLRNENLSCAAAAATRNVSVNGGDMSLLADQVRVLSERSRVDLVDAKGVGTTSV